ncbi:hypothetical protein B4Q13_17730, partial [Lacticaseibacillus rhamnosus]
VATDARTTGEFRLTVVLAKEIKNSIGMPLVLIPAGNFRMGSPADEKDRGDDEGPQHEVEITRPFYLGKYPVTRGQFRRAPRGWL